MIIDIRPAFTPMPMPITAGYNFINFGNTSLGNSTNAPTRLTTNQLSPATAIFRSCVHSQRSDSRPRGPPCAECTVLLRRIRLFLSIMESCIQSVKRDDAGEGLGFRTFRPFARRTNLSS